MRAKTVRPIVNNSNIPVKRTSEGIETSKVQNENIDNSSVNVAANVTANVIAPVFPVKTVLKKSTEVEIQEIDKENIDPFTGAPVEWDDLDAEDSGDPLMVSDYVVEIFDYMKQLEVIRSGIYVDCVLMLMICMFVYVYVYVCSFSSTFYFHL